MNDHLNKISALIIRCLEGEQLSIQEQQVLDEWLKSSPQNQELFSKLNDPLYVKEELEKMYNYNTEESWQKMMAKNDAGENIVAIQKLRSWKYWITAAAILFAIAGAALLFVYTPVMQKQVADHTIVNPRADIAAPPISKATITLQDGTRIAIDSTDIGNMAIQGKTKIRKTGDGQIQYSAEDEVVAEKQFNTLTNPRGSRVVQLTLSDGTKVWLNAESKIRYPVAFTGLKREVEIEGEVYFEVAKDPAKHFLVQSNGTTVQVTGTHFNINAYKDEASLDVTLLEGAVKVSKANHSINLTPGEQAKVSNDIQIHRQVNTEDVMAWKNGLFIFNGTDIYTTMRQLSRWYDVDVKFNENITERFYGDISREKNISGVLTMLETTGSVHFKTNGNMIEVYK